MLWRQPTIKESGVSRGIWYEGHIRMGGCIVDLRLSFVFVIKNHLNPSLRLNWVGNGWIFVLNVEHEGDGLLLIGLYMDVCQPVSTASAMGSLSSAGRPEYVNDITAERAALNL